MKIATRNTIAAALAVALAGMGMPVAALAANSADDVVGAAVAANSEDVLVVESFYDWKDEVSLEDLNGKWFRIARQSVEGADFETVKYMIKTNKSGGLDFYVDGTGNAGMRFPVPSCADEYAEAHDRNGTLYIGAGITRIGTDEPGRFNIYAKNVSFTEGSQIKEIGPMAFSGGISSVNLENCRELETIHEGAFLEADCDITVPSSVTEVYGDPFNGVTGEIKVEDPENTPVIPTVATVAAPKLSVVNPNKVKVTWAKPYTSSWSSGKLVKKTVPYSVRYKVQHRVKGAKTWTKSSMTSSKSKTLSMLTKGKKYQVRVTAYKKSGSSWKALTTSTYKTSSAVKGYNPAPSLKAGKKSITASWAKVPGATSYKVYYKKSTSKKWSTKKVGKSAKVKLSKLSSKKTYQVRVVAYKGKTGICQSSTFKSVKVK